MKISLYSIKISLNDISFISIGYISIISSQKTIWLVDSTLLKNMTSSVGIMTFPSEWKVIKFMFQATNQLCEFTVYRQSPLVIYPYISPQKTLYPNIPSGKLTVRYWSHGHLVRWFNHQKWWICPVRFL
jgi:hypothetical protein